MQVIGNTDKGLVRDNNQDDFAMGTAGNCAWAIVCDGMGGANGGNVASNMTVERFKKAIEQYDFRTVNMMSAERLFNSAIASANVLVFDRGTRESELFGMGTTAVAVIADQNNAYIAHVGDSRAYHISGGEIKQVTRDHSMVQSLVESGKITSDEAKNHEKKNVITRAIGVGRDVSIEFDQIGIAKGDIILLCSDGLTNYVDDNDILNLALSDVDTAADKLVEAAVAGGGGDNVTAVLILC